MYQYDQWMDNLVNNVKVIGFTISIIIITLTVLVIWFYNTFFKE